MIHSDKFKKAFDLISSIHSQDGDKSGWLEMREEAQQAVTKYESFEKWSNDISRRTDISDDFKWEIECKIESFNVLFALMRGL